MAEKQLWLVNSKPTKRKLLDHVIPHVAPHWYDLGIKLLNEEQESQLDIIESNHPDNKKECCKRMFWYWLSTNTDASWQLLIEVLRSPAIELPVVAANIEEMLTEENQQEAVTSQIDQQNRQGVASIDRQSETSQPVQEPPVNSTIAEFENITEAFLFLTSNISKLLHSEDFYTIRRACIEQTNTPNGVQLSPAVMGKITSANKLNILLDILALSPYWSWIDLRLLQALVVASGSLAAKNLLTTYKNAIFSKKLIDVLPDIPSKEVKDEYYTRIISKFGKELEELTIFDLLKRQSQLETVIMELKRGTCALAHISEGCIEIHWIIPTDYIDHVYNTACLKRHKYDMLQLQYLQIGNFSKIYNPSNQYSIESVVPKLPQPINVANCKGIIDHFYHFLTNEMDSDVFIQDMFSQRLLNDKEAHILMNASSNFQKNCLVLEKIRTMDTKYLVTFCNMLQMFDSQKHIASTLLNALKSFGFLSSDPISQSTTSVESQEPMPAPVISVYKSRKRPAYTDQPTGQKYFKPSAVQAEFLDTKMQLEQILQTSSSGKVYEQCKSLMASQEHDIPLLSNKCLNVLKECNFVSEILQRLSPYFNWSDHSVLRAVVKACDNPEAALILQQFDSQIDLSLPITEYPVPQPAPSMAPHDTSTQTILAIKLDTELNSFSLQQVIELQALIQKNLKITEYCLQLVAVKRGSTILYWMIPKCISHLISSKIIQDCSFYDGKIQEICVYPGTLFVSADILQIGPLSFLSQTNNTLPRNENELLSVQLNDLKQLPNTMSKLNLELIQKEEQLKLKKGYIKHIMVQTERDDLADQDRLQYKSSMMHLKESNAFLEEKIVKEKQKYSDLMGKYEELQSSTSLDSEVGLLKQKIVKEKTNYSDLLRKYEDLQNSLSFGSEVQIELKNLQITMEKVTINLEKIQLLKSDKESKFADLTNKGDKESEEFSNKKPLVNKLKELNSNLTTIKNWSEVMQLLQTELSDSKEKIEQLESVVEKLEAQLQKYQEKNHQLDNELSEMSSRLLVKDKELIKLKEDNKLLIKQIRERKQKKIREIIPQDQLIQHELIGSGRYGEVYKISCSDKLYAGKIIYKKLLPGYPHPSEINKLLGEIEKISAMLVTNHHPNIEQFHSVLQVTLDSPPVLLTELLHENLNNYIARMKGKLLNHAQLDLCHDMGKGLQFLHTAGLVHNNLHGANVLISKDGQAKIADYICPLVDTLNKQTMLQHNIYTSPELIKNITVYSKQSDIYSLGILCLQVSTQSPPMPKESAELSEVQRWKEQLDQIATNPIFPLILQCLGMVLARPSIDRVCAKLQAAKESPQSIMSDILYHIKNTTEFGVALQSGRYKLKWTKCSNLPVAMTYAKVIVINDILYIGGGGCTTVNDEYYIFSYQLTDDQWTKLPILPYCYGVPINIDNQLSYIGGYDPSTGLATNKVITLEDNKWTKKYHNMIVARQHHAAVTYQHYIIVAGGVGEDESTLDTIEVFNCNNYQWTIVSTHLPQPMKVINATTCNQSFIIAGYVGADDRSHNGTFIITMDSLLEHQQSITSSTSEDDNKWNQLCYIPYYDSTIVPNTFPPVIIGGEDQQSKTVNKISLYDDSSDSWRTIEISPITCGRATVATINNIIIIAGGYTDSSSLEATIATTLTSVVLGQLELCD